MLALPRYLFCVSALLVMVLLTGCPDANDAKAPIATQLVPSSVAPADRVLVVVLPGRGDDIEHLRNSGIAESIQNAWPQADVLLADVTMPYYFEGRMPERLHNEVVLPARRRGYREVWLAGASLGGMGALLYDRRYPREMTGLVLLAPYLGEKDVIEEISDAGGLANWQPVSRPEPAAVNTPALMQWRTAERGMWRYLKSWNDQSKARGRNVWIAYGESDRLNAVLPLVAPLLPKRHVLLIPGGHGWVVWTPAANEIFTQIHASNVAMGDAHSR
jgi:pimeloyl-ACP methyl ester carboxylesterase